jgi:hypothetical protein
MKYTLLVSLVLITAGAVSALDTGPELQDIRIHDVSGLDQTQWRTGGDLVASGTNKTFTVGHSDRQKLYRFTFVVQNTGTDSWTLESGDVLYHDGLNETWDDKDIWYNITESRTGGTLSSGRLDWDTSNGGTVGTESSNDTLYASYVINISHNRTVEHQQLFEAADYSEANSTEDYHRSRLLKYGIINPEIQEPPEGTVMTRDELFPVNATFRCVSGSCGELSATTRYNESGMTAVPESSGEPFYAQQNPRECTGYLGFNETCELEWQLNATGDLETAHKLDVLGNSNLSEVNSAETENRTVEINSAVYIDITWQAVDFGVLEPGDEQRPAEGNDNLQYNVTVGEQSETPEALWIKSTGLEGPLDYTIPPENITFAKQNDYSNSEPLSSSYQVLESNPQPGDLFQTFYWLNTPEGLYKGDYSGQLTVKANATN